MKCDKSGREASLNKKRVVTPNDLKLSDCPARRDGCAGESGGAAGVTRGAVRSSAWLGVGAANTECEATNNGSTIFSWAKEEFRQLQGQLLQG